MPRALSSLAALALVAVAASCHHSRPALPATATTATAPFLQEEPLVAVKQTTVDQLTFKIDPARSRSQISTTLDPDGLGARTSKCTCPLKGEVQAQLTTRPDGTRVLDIGRISLATTTSAAFSYNWTPLIGKISTTIPSGVLKITDHQVPGPFPLDARGQFRQPDTHFSVACWAEVKGSGLVLSRKIGAQKTDLDITKTRPVTLSGSLVRHNGDWILHVPSAVMQDNFDLDGNALDLTFTADITATAAGR